MGSEIRLRSDRIRNVPDRFASVILERITACVIMRIAIVAALKRDDVHLLTDKITRVVPEGLLTSDGVVHEADIIIYGTGFKADQFLVPMQIIGRDGRDLRRRGRGAARAPAPGH